jgi:hypothetical protein
MAQAAIGYKLNRAGWVVLGHMREYQLIRRAKSGCLLPKNYRNVETITVRMSTVDALEAAGYIEAAPGAPNSLFLTDAGRAAWLAYGNR